MIQIKNLSKVYQENENKVVAVNNISLTIEKGEFVAITGASGSGKSTLLHLLGGIDQPTSGEISIENTNIATLKEDDLTVFRRKNIGIVYQFYNLLPVLTVEENLSLPYELQYKKTNNKKVEELIQVLNLQDRKHHLPSQLSGGQQQRVSIGRALINEPAVILADEPTGNLDTKSSHEIIELLKTCNKKFHQTIVLVTHDLTIASQADRIITIQDGAILEDKRTSL